MKPIACQRHLFEIPEEVTYYNCAYMSPLAQPVIESGMQGMQQKSRPWEVLPKHFFEGSTRVRTLFAELIGSTAKDVAILPSVSYGVGIAAANLPLAQRHHVLVLEEQFPSNYYPWQELAKQKQATVRFVPKPAEEDNWTSALLRTMNQETAIVAVPNCHWIDGGLLDLEAIGKECRRRSIPLVIDATQSIGVMPIDLQAIKPAFLITATYKWMLGPYNMALMYVAPEYQNGVPLEYNWMNRHGSETFSGVANYTEQLVSGAAKYDMGEHSNFILLPMVAKALELLLNWGVKAISATLGSYNQDIAAGVAELGFKTSPREKTAPHLIGLRFEGALPSDLAQRLMAENVFVSVRGDAVRISPHIYNNERDKARFFDAMKKVIARE